MRKLVLFLLFTTFHFFGQDISEINKNINLSETLEFEREIRIYKDYSITTSIEIFRMYDEGQNNWTVVIYYYNKEFKTATKINEIQFPKENIGKLKVKDANLIWLNFILNDIEYLPSIKDIDYKLKTTSIEIEDGEKIILKRKISPLDGESYEVFVKNGKVENHFIFNGLNSYLKHYPQVDELISYNKLLSIINTEFNLWND
jgi:hypothetical protein